MLGLFLRASLNTEMFSLHGHHEIPGVLQYALGSWKVALSRRPGIKVASEMVESDRCWLQSSEQSPVSSEANLPSVTRSP